MFPCRRLNSKWPLQRGRAPYILREGGPTGSRGRQGTSGPLRRERCRGGQWIITRRTNYFHHCTSHHSPTASEQLGEVRAYNGQQVNEGTMCTENVHGKCARLSWTMAGTHRSWMGRSVPAHIVVFSISLDRANSTLCLPIFNYHSIVDSLITLSANFQLLFNCDQTQCQNFNGSSQFPICFYHPNPSH